MYRAIPAPQAIESRNARNGESCNLSANLLEAPEWEKLQPEIQTISHPERKALQPEKCSIQTAGMKEAAT